MSFIQLKSYGVNYPAPCINTESVTYFEEYSSNNNYGSLIHLENGEKVLCGNSPDQLTALFNSKTGES